MELGPEGRGWGDNECAAQALVILEVEKAATERLELAKQPRKCPVSYTVCFVYRSTLKQEAVIRVRKVSAYSL